MPSSRRSAACSRARAASASARRSRFSSTTSSGARATKSGLASFADEYLTAWVGERFVTSLRIRLFAHLQKLSVGWFERRQLGDIISRLTGDIAAIEELMLTGVNMTLTYSFQLLFFAGMMFVLNWQLTLASFIAAPAFLLLSRAFSRRIQNASRDLRRRSGSITSVAEETPAQSSGTNP